MNHVITAAIAAILLGGLPLAARSTEANHPINIEANREPWPPLLFSPRDSKGPYIGAIERRQIRIENGCTQPAQMRDMLVLETADATLPLLASETKEFDDDDTKTNDLQLGDLVEVEGTVRTFLWTGTVAMAPVQGLIVEKAKKTLSGERSSVQPKTASKRVAPAEIASLDVGNFVYRAESKTTQNSFETWIVAERRDKQSKQPTQIWRTSVISGSINPALEADVQDVRLKSLRHENGILVATPESGAVLRIDAKTGRVLSSPEAETPVPTNRAQLKSQLTEAFNRLGIPQKTSEKTAEDISRALWNNSKKHRGDAIRKTLEALQ